MIKLIKYQQSIVDRVDEIVPHSYLVGGACRSILLGNEPKDWDFCTIYTPEQIEHLITTSINKYGHKRKAYTVGKRFGTLGFKLDTGENIEITSQRKETYNKNNRKPEVSFGATLTEDLERRDFTINSIVYTGSKFLDYFSGIQDLNDKLISSVQSPKKMIKDDPLRILRCARFMSQLGFTVESCLEQEIKKYAHKILNVSKERWVQELDKILISDNMQQGLTFLMRNDLFNYMIPELSLQYNYDQQSPWHVHDLWTHTLHVVNEVPEELLDLRWAALLHDIGKPFCQKFKKGEGKYVDRMRYIHHADVGRDITYSICKKLKFSNKRTDFIVDIVKNHMKEDSILSQYDKVTNEKPKLDFL